MNLIWIVIFTLQITASNESTNKKQTKAAFLAFQREL